MKARMKKISILTFHKEREKVVDILQQVGVIHLEIDRNYRNDDVETLEKEQSQMQKVLEAIHDSTEDGASTSHPDQDKPIEQVVEEVLDLRMRVDTNVQELEVLRKEKLLLEPWGHFDRSRLSEIQQRGIGVYFYMSDASAFNKHDFGDTHTYVIHEGGNRVYFVILSDSDMPDLPFDEVVLPERSLAEVERRQHVLAGDHDRVHEEIRSYHGYVEQLEDALSEVTTTLAYYQANGSFDRHSNGAILSIRGWFPASIQGRLEHYLKKSHITYGIALPVPGDQVPILLRNSRYPKLFETITKIFQLPNYYEMDLTPFIAVFYPIFFAYCLGDAGYGVVLLAAAIIGAFTFMKKARNLAALGVVLGLLTTVMGVVKSGSIFGIPLQGAEHPFLEYLSGYVIIGDDRSVVFNAFNVALMIGVVQIFVGVLLAIVNKWVYQGFAAALPVIGKLFIIAPAIGIFLASNQGVEPLQPHVGWMKALAIFGIILVLAFHDSSLAWGKRIPAGLLPLFFIFTGLLGDTLSYVRLFALGVASSVLGLVVNQIGMQIMGDSWLSIGIAVVFLLFGHALNLALATLGAFVHPLRLTFVEFYSNAQFEGGGVAYQPFRKRLRSIED